MKINQYPRVQSDVADDEEYETERPRSRSSVRRYHPGDFHGEPIPPVAQRSSLRRASQPGRPTTSTQNFGLDDASSAQTERLSADWQPPVHVRPSRAVKPLPSRAHERWQDYRPNQENWFQRHQIAIGGGMCTALLLAWIGWHLFAWCSNLIVDPLTYTQAADRNVATVVMGKHHARITAFVDPQTHLLDTIVIPEDGGKPQLITGKVVPFAHPMVSVEQEHNGDIVETVQGPFDETFWLPQRPTTQSWTLSFDQKPAQK